MQVRKLENRKIERLTKLDNEYSVYIDVTEAPLYEVWLLAPSGRMVTVTSTYEHNFAISLYHHCIACAAMLQKEN